MALDTDVLIVGAGPTGLMLANWLARLGVRHLVLDDGPGPTRESRALVVQARSMELYNQLGVIDRVRDRAAWARGIRPGWHTRPAPGIAELARFSRGLTPHPGLHVLEQSANEEILHDHLRELGSSVAWGHRLTALADRGDHVEAELKGPDGPRTVTAAWCVGADGASSAVRRAAGIDFEGRTNAERFWLADALGVRGVDEGIVNLRAGEKHFLLAFPMGAPGHHRLIGILRDGEEPTEADIRAILARDFAVEFDRATWFAHYRLHHRVARRFRQGRVFLAGDAAHVHSPVGGQGMNTGLQDAHNLAFKLAAVIAGQAEESHLDHYELERRPVAQKLVATVDRLFGAVVDASPRAVTMRRLVVPIAAPLVTQVVARLPVATRLGAYVGQLRIHYWATEAARARGGRRDPVVGRRLPWTGANHEVLRAATWQVHAYAQQAPSLDGLPGVIAHAYRFDAADRLGLPEGTWLLVRPDGFVAARATAATAGTVFTAALQELGVRTA
ncbi:FAD-dependent monooxygenase [Mariniluteicoccus flavus]